MALTEAPISSSMRLDLVSRIFAALVIGATLLLGGCNRSPDGIDGIIDGQRALAFLYGPYDSRLQGTRWKVARLPRGSKADEVLTEGGDAIVTVALAKAVKEGDVDRFYLGVVITPTTAAGEEGFDCESCEPVVGATIFVKRGDRWLVEAHQPFLTTLGFHGSGPAMRLVTIGLARHAIAAEIDWFHQGNTGTYFSLWTQEQGQIAERFAARTQEENNGNCSDDPAAGIEPCHENALDIQYQPGPLAERYDIHVRPNDPAWKYDNQGHQGELVFRFDGTKYTPVELKTAALVVADKAPWSGPLPDEDPTTLLTAFLRADAWGLQLSSEHWPLVTRFATWLDGPGWDESAVVESAAIVAHHIQGARAQIDVRMRVIGTLHADGEGMPVLDTSTAATVTRKFALENSGKNGETHWKIVAPQDGPHLAVDYVLLNLMPAWCGKRDCNRTEAFRVLHARQQVCPPSPVRLNRSCRKQGS